MGKKGQYSSRFAIGLLCLPGLFVWLWPQTTGQPYRLLLEESQSTTLPHQSAWICGTSPDLRFHSRVRRVDDGIVVAYDPEPPLLSPDYQGEILLRDFTIVGDHQQISFSCCGDETLTFTRTSTAIVGGQVVSIFNPVFPNSVLDHLATRGLGIDQPGAWPSGGIGYLGPVGGAAPPWWNSGISIAFSPFVAPRAKSRRLSRNVQYTSHIVNIMAPGYYDCGIGDGSDCTGDSDMTAAYFYTRFSDIYQQLAIVPIGRPPTWTFRAYHYSTQNQVTGIGREIYEIGPGWGGHALEGVSYYPYPGDFANNSLATHETGHQWGHFIDWESLGDYEPYGHQPGSHAPLWADRECQTCATGYGTTRSAEKTRQRDQKITWEVAPT